MTLVKTTGRHLAVSALFALGFYATPSAAAECDVPEAAIVVAPGGDDAATGTRAAPLRTVSAGIERARAGGTVAVRAGTYRESLPDLSKPLTLMAFECEDVTLKGSRIVDGWRRDGAAWSVPWPHVFCSDCAAPGNLEPDFPLAGRPDQAFLDGAPLRQVARSGELSPGTFMVADGRLHIGDDPVGRVVEGVVHSTALRIWRDGAGTRVLGLRFTQFSPTAEPGLGGMVKGDAANLVFEGNTFTFSAVKGLSIYGPGARVRGNTFADNGMMGLEAWRADGLVVENNSFERNNRERFVVTGEVSEAAGAKITETRGVEVTGNTFAANHATGLWLDIDVARAHVNGNDVRENARHGIFYEISTDAVIAGNEVRGNATSGIALADSTNVRVEGNTIVGNGIALLVQDDERAKADESDGNTWTSAGHVIARNRLSGRGPLIWVRDFTGRIDADAMVAAMTGNRYALEGGPFAEWWRGTQAVTFDTLDAFRAGTGFER